MTSCFDVRFKARAQIERRTPSPVRYVNNLLVFGASQIVLFIAPVGWSK